MRRASFKEYLKVKSAWLILALVLGIGLMTVAIKDHAGLPFLFSGLIILGIIADYKDTFLCTKCLISVGKKADVCPNCGKKLQGG